MGLFGGIGKAFGAMGRGLTGGGGNQNQKQPGGMFGNVIQRAQDQAQQRGLGPSAPPEMPQSPMPDVPMGNPNQDTLPQPRQAGWGPQVISEIPRPQQGPGFWERAVQQRQQGPPPDMGPSVPQGQFNSWNPDMRAAQMGVNNFTQGGGGQMMPPQAQMGRGQMKQQQMGLGPSPQMGMNRPMPQRGGNFGQGTGGRMGGGIMQQPQGRMPMPAGMTGGGPRNPNAPQR